MKQLVFFTLLFIVIPSFLLFFIDFDEKELNLEFENKIMVRVKRSDNKIEKVDLEKYVMGVIAGEMPLSFPMEALKAQAVAARSYVMKRIEYNKKKEYDVSDTTMSQVYLDDNYLKEKWKDDYVKNKNKIIQIVLDTKNECVYYGNKIADTLFFSTSNGYTEDSLEVFGFDTPYLKSVDSLWDEEVSPVFNDSKTMEKEKFCEKLNIDECNNIKIEIIDKTTNGRIKKIKINDEELSGSNLVSLLGLRSNDFEIKVEDDNVIITTKGYGHGVGMSQYGAMAMANKGYSYKEILSYYYKETTVKKMNY